MKCDLKIVMALALFLTAFVAVGGIVEAVDADGTDPSGTEIEGGDAPGSEDPPAPVMPEKVKVTYIVGASSISNEASVTVGAFRLLESSPITIPAGFIFGGWSETENDNSTLVQSLAVKLVDGAYLTEYTVHAILLPDHTADDFQVTYVIPDHADVVVTVPMGTAFPVKLLAPEDFEAYGIAVPVDKVFKGWFTAPSEGVAVESVGADATVVSDGGAGPVYALDDVVVYAVYTDNTQVSVTWKIDGAEDETQTYFVGEQIVHDAPSKDGFAFKGWVEVVGETETPVTEFPTATADVVYKAVFEAIPVPEPEPEPAPEKDDSGMTALLCVIGVIIVIGGALFVWTLKKDKKL